MEQLTITTKESKPLPAEILTKIFSYISSSELKDCRLVSKQFYDVILTSSELVRKLQFTLQVSDGSGDCEPCKQRAMNKLINGNGTEVTESSEPPYRPKGVRELPICFLEPPKVEDFEGPFIRCVRLKLGKSDKFSWKFLEKMSNLEDLLIVDDKYETYDYLPVTEENPVDIPNLKSLDINLRLLKSFASVNCNLEKLSVKVTTDDHQEVLTDFVARQSNLTYLFLNLEMVDKIRFPVTDITSNLKFKLKKLKIKMKNVTNKSEHFHQFFESQAEHLESLVLNFEPNDELFELIVTKCKNLKHLRLETSPKSEMYGKPDEALQLPSLQSIKDSFFDDSKFKTIIKRFPNVVEIQAEMMKGITGTYDKITRIKVEDFFCHTMGDCAFPNLKELHIQDCYESQNKNWKKFNEHILDLENLKVKNMC